MSWYERVVDLTPRQRRHYVGHILSAGRWLYKHAPEVYTPEQWTEDLALSFRSDLCSWTCGQYGSDKGRHFLEGKGDLGKLLKPQAIASHLTSMRRYFNDLMKRPHAVGGAPARRLTFGFSPGEAFAVPDSVRRALDRTEPRDINLLVWAKLAIAAATLSQSDLTKSPRYPLSFYRAVALVWATSARRPNEIARLRVECVREDWAPDLLDEDDQPVERLIKIGTNGQQEQEQREETSAKIYYLHIPSGKSKVMWDHFRAFLAVDT
jgi:hypothetical protein